MNWLVIVQKEENGRIKEYVPFTTKQDCLNWIAVHNIGFVYEGEFNIFLSVDDNNNVSYSYDFDYHKDFLRSYLEIKFKFTQSWTEPYTADQQSQIDELNFKLNALNTAVWRWDAPVPMPEDAGTGTPPKIYSWDEDNTQWVELVL